MSEFYEPEYAPEGFGDEGGDELALRGKACLDRIPKGSP